MARNELKNQRPGWQFISCLGVLGLGLGSVMTVAAVAQETGAIVQATAPKQAPSNLDQILTGLPRPQGSPRNLATMFGANAYGQKMLNFQVKLKPEQAAQFYKTELTKKGYVERPINTQVAQWGINLVFDPPATMSLRPTSPAKKVALVVQGTMLGPDTININVRFEEL
ncbi:MAG: hypothetical protein EA001_01440 [Oscillatoriales cyanobacterium]|nr:MAG: hypothetical protein EA001_01440 [Oscillatoriales cyanobacterium]